MKKEVNNVEDLFGNIKINSYLCINHLFENVEVAILYLVWVRVIVR